MTVRISSIAFASVACAALVSGNLFAQPAADPNSAPNAYHVDEGWAKLQQGRRWGAAVGVDMDDVGLTLEEQGVASFHQSFQEVLAALDTKAAQLGR